MTTKRARYPKDEQGGMRVKISSLGKSNVPMKD